MKVGDITKVIISKGENKGKPTQEVVYKTYLGRHNDKPRYSSRTKHERV